MVGPGGSAPRTHFPWVNGLVKYVLLLAIIEIGESKLQPESVFETFGCLVMVSAISQIEALDQAESFGGEVGSALQAWSVGHSTYF